MKLLGMSGLAAMMISCMPQAQVGAPNGATSGLSTVTVNLKKDSQGYKTVEKAVTSGNKANKMGYSLQVDLDSKSSAECKKHYDNKTSIVNKVAAIGSASAVKVGTRVKTGCTYKIVIGLGNFADKKVQAYVSNVKKPLFHTTKAAKEFPKVTLIATKAGESNGITPSVTVTSADPETTLDIDIDIDLPVEAQKPNIPSDSDKEADNDNQFAESNG